MKFKKANIHRRFSLISNLVKEDTDSKSLTSFSGLLIFQKLIEELKLKSRLKYCFEESTESKVYSQSWTSFFLITHFLLGYKRLRDIDFYKEDPMVERVLGVRCLPDVSTLSRRLSEVGENSIGSLRDLNSQIVMDRVDKEGLSRLTLDFDGSVLTTKRKAEGTAVGYNKMYKGRRSYYPLFCTLSQTGQFLDMHHRPGNVHDSNGAEDFVIECINKAKRTAPRAVLETRMDSAFFQEELIDTLNSRDVEFTVSVPFYRYSCLKSFVENRKRWKNGTDFSYFEIDWSPKSWPSDYRIVIVRSSQGKQRKGPLQLDLFEPLDFEYKYQAIITNKKISPKKIVEFHRGRGSQEKIFSEAKSQMNMGNIPVRSLNGNKLYCLASILAHNLTHELQMNAYERKSGTTENRSTLWSFEGIASLRKRLIQRAGRIIRPKNKLTLIIGANQKIFDEINTLVAA